MSLFNKIFGKPLKAAGKEFVSKRYCSEWGTASLENVREPIYKMVRLYKKNPERFEIEKLIVKCPLLRANHESRKDVVTCFLVKDLNNGLKFLVRIDGRGLWEKFTFIEEGIEFTNEEANSGIEDMRWVNDQECNYILNFAIGSGRRLVYSQKSSQRRNSLARRRLRDIYK